MNTISQDSLHFSSLSCKEVRADFSGGQMTSDAGVLLLRETENRVGIIAGLSQVIRDERHQSYIKHTLKGLLCQRVFQIACGYEDANDSNELRVDPAIKTACDKLPSEQELASQPTFSRLENSIQKTDLYRIAESFVENFIDSYQRPPEAIILDMDDTDDPTHGSQQLQIFNGYFDEYCYMPLHIYEGISGKLVTTILRPGKRSSGKEVVSIIKRIVKKIRQAWPKVGILLRGDSHFASPKVFTWCEKNNVHYLFGLTKNSILRTIAEPTLEQARRAYSKNGDKVRMFKNLQYQASTWHRKIRVIFKAEITERGENPRFIVTSLETHKPSFIYETVYCSRGQMENFIKDHKLALNSDRTSCHDFSANSFRLFLHSAAYVLMHALRDKALAGTELAKAQFDTIRLRVLKIGAEVRELKTKLIFRLPSSYPKKDLLQTMMHNLALSP
jgi:Transposase DDE domain group 1